MGRIEFENELKKMNQGQNLVKPTEAYVRYMHKN